MLDLKIISIRFSCVFFIRNIFKEYRKIVSRDGKYILVVVKIKNKE